MKITTDKECPLVTVEGRENISHIRLILKKMTLNWTQLLHVIVPEDLTFCKVYISIRHTGVNNVLENKNQMMGL